MMESKNFKGHGALLIAYAIFGLNVPIAKNVLIHAEVCSPIALTFYRIAGGALLFWLSSLFTRKEHVPVRDLLMLMLASVLAVFLNQVTFVIGLSKTSPIDASVIVTTSPMMTMLLAAFFLKEPVTWKKTLGVLVGALGALLLIFTGASTEQRNSNLAGNLLCLLSSLSFSIYLAAFKNIILKYSPVTVMKWMFLFATVFCLPFGWHDVVKVQYASISMDIYLQIIYVVVLATFISYLLIPVGQKLLRPTIVSMYNYLQPVIASLVAVVLGMDTFGWIKGIATLLIFLGVYIVTQSKSYAQLQAEKQRDKGNIIS
jgi:drug/metabolite transporter (DMT)-like permease